MVLWQAVAALIAAASIASAIEFKRRYGLVLVGNLRHLVQVHVLADDDLVFSGVIDLRRQGIVDP